MAALPTFAELVVEGAATDASSARGTPELEIVVGDIVIRAGAGADEGQLDASGNLSWRWRMKRDSLSSSDRGAG